MPTDPLLRRILPGCGLLVVTGILFLLFGFGSTPASGNLVPTPWDKLVHLGVFATLALGLRILLPRLPWPLIYALALSTAIADELHQFFVPNRQPDWDDGLADAVGIVFGLLAWQLLDKLIPAGRPERIH